MRAALVTPLSGPLAVYGRASAVALRVWAEEFSGTKDAVHLKIVDAHPDVRVATLQAEGDAPHLVFGPYGSGPMAAVAAASTRLVWNHGGARLAPRENVVNVLAPAATYFEGTLDVVHRADPAIRTVCVSHRDTGFSRAVGNGAADAAHRLGLQVERVVLPKDPAEADVLLVVGGFDDERTFAERFLPGRWAAASMVSAGVAEVLAGLGDRREGLLGPAQWLSSTAPQPDEGPSAGDFVASYYARTGHPPPYPAAQAFAAGVIAMRCLREASTAADSQLREVAQNLTCTTLFGGFRLDPSGTQVGHRVLTVQWQDGSRVVVWPPEQAHGPLRYPLS